MKFIISMLCFTGILFAQTDWNKWGKANYSYEIPVENNKRDFSLGNNFGEAALKTFVDVYWFFISDLDGNNCSFNPTCSAFFLEAVKETNIFQGFLMFADRFTRDSNFYKFNHYPKAKNGFFYDPPSIYNLNEKEISFIPPDAVVIDE